LQIKFSRKLKEELSYLREPSLRKLDLAVAFVKNDGLDIIDSLGLSVSRAVIGDAFCNTEPDAIERLRKSHDSHVRVAEVEHAGGIFHPKLYMLPYDDSLAAIVGSANLTQAALEYNEEANLVLTGQRDEPPIPSIVDYFNLLWNEMSIEITDEWMKNYREKFESLPKDRLIDEKKASSILRSVSLNACKELVGKASNFWVVVTTPENFRICIQKGLWGVNRQTKTIQQVKPGDIVTFYVKGWKNFRGVYRVEGGVFRDTTKVWPDKPYPLRVRIKPLNQVGSANAYELRNKLELIKNPAVWGTYFQREMFQVRPDDIEAVLEAMKGKVELLETSQTIGIKETKRR
jgi:HKD family nuclease/predicted RNA-binding protein